MDYFTTAVSLRLSFHTRCMVLVRRPELGVRATVPINNASNKQLKVFELANMPYSGVTRHWVSLAPFTNLRIFMHIWGDRC